MKTSQEKAIAYFRRFLETQQCGKVVDHDKVITEFKTEEHRSFISVAAQIDIPSLGENNVLRAISHEYWLVFVGPRGGITAKMYPKSFDQFKSRRNPVFGMNFR